MAERALRSVTEAAARRSDAHAVMDRQDADQCGAFWDPFLTALRPLHAAGKLGFAPSQSPHCVSAVPMTSVHVEHCAERMHPFLTASEFRHESWLNDGNRESGHGARHRARHRRCTGGCREACPDGVGDHVARMRHRATARAQREVAERGGIGG